MLHSACSCCYGNCVTHLTSTQPPLSLLKGNQGPPCRRDILHHKSSNHHSHIPQQHTHLAHIKHAREGTLGPCVVKRSSNTTDDVGIIRTYVHACIFAVRSHFSQERCQFALFCFSICSSFTLRFGLSLRTREEAENGFTNFCQEKQIEQDNC